MPAQYIYQHAQGSNVDLSGQVRAYTQEVSMNAEEGSVAISSITVDDQLGGLDIIGHHKFLIRETSEASNSKTILYGLVADRDVARGPFKIANSRQWTVNLADVNSLLGRPIMRGADSNRPAETDVARIQWLMTTGEMQLILDTTYISTTGPVAMDAVDYRDQTLLSVIDDCAQASGKNYWVIVMNEDQNPRLGLFYDFAASTAYTSSVRLTNVLADVDSSTTFAVFNDDLKLNRDPSRVFAEVLLPFDGGEVFVTRASTVVLYGRRDTTAPSVNVKTTAKATARANRYLDDIATEEDRLTMSYLVPLAKVNRLMHGHRFQVKFSHLPGYQDWTYVRALKRTVKMESEEFYRVTIEATQSTGGGTAVVCSAQNPPNVTDTDYGGITGHGGFWGFSDQPPTPSAYPCVVFDGFGGGNGFNFVLPHTLSGTPGTNGMLTASGYTQIGNINSSPIQIIAGYAALSSGAPPLFAYVTDASCDGGSFESFSLRTSATAPVQNGTQSGAQLVFPGTPTPGNIIVMYRVVSTNQAGTDSNPSLLGWTRAYTADGSAAPGGTGLGISWGGIAGGCLSVWTRCVQTGDTSTYDVGASPFAYLFFGSEWALT